jgi:hypothetical protein
MQVKIMQSDWKNIGELRIDIEFELNYDHMETRL